MTKYVFSDFDDEDDDSSKRYSFGQKIDSKELIKGYSQKPLVAYEHLDIDVTDYSFSQRCLDNTDIVQYFKALKKFSSLTINEILDDSEHSKHFHFYPIPRGALKSLLEDVAGKKLNIETLPTVGQFALYTSKERASRSTSIKSPRIYFIIGQNAIMHILFYDPYHELN